MYVGHNYKATAPSCIAKEYRTEHRVFVPYVNNVCIVSARLDVRIHRTYTNLHSESTGSIIQMILAHCINYPRISFAM